MVPINKIAADADAALDGVGDGAVVLVGGFGTAGAPAQLLGALARRNLRDLTVVSNNAGAADDGLERLLLSGAVRKMVCSYPKAPGSVVFPRLYAEHRIELELVPQGTLSERIRAAGAGVSAFFVRTAAGTDLAAGKEQRMIDGQLHVLETALRADLALIRAARGDRWGNLTYRKSGRNFGPTMAAAAATSVAEVAEVVELGTLDPESVVTPGIFVDWVVAVAAEPAGRAGVEPAGEGAR
jgi:3-oxoadipate CoA-transferase alpha subunit